MKFLFLFGGGDTSDDTLHLEDSYITRISHTNSIERRNVTSKGRTPIEIRSSETAALQATIKPTDFVILFDERGKKLSSPQFSKLLERAELDGKRVVVIVGGAYGVDEEIRTRAQQVVSFSDMIFPHDLARVMAIEQVYRGLQIIKGSPYHHAD